MRRLPPCMKPYPKGVGVWVEPDEAGLGAGTGAGLGAGTGAGAGTGVGNDGFCAWGLGTGVGFVGTGSVGLGTSSGVLEDFDINDGRLLGRLNHEDIFSILEEVFEAVFVPSSNGVNEPESGLNSRLPPVH